MSQLATCHFSKSCPTHKRFWLRIGSLNMLLLWSIFSGVTSSFLERQSPNNVLEWSTGINESLAPWIKSTGHETFTILGKQDLINTKRNDQQGATRYLSIVTMFLRGELWVMRLWMISLLTYHTDSSLLRLYHWYHIHLTSSQGPLFPHPFSFQPFQPAPPMVLEDVAKQEGNDAPTNMSGGRPDGDKWRHQDHASQWVLCCQKNRRAAPQRSTKDNHRWVAHPQVVHQISEDRQRHFEDGLCGMQVKDKDSEAETRITRTASKFTEVSGRVAGEECFGHLPPCSIPKVHAVVNLPSWKLPIFKRKLLYTIPYHLLLKNIF